jgi:hypothetical protein
METEWAENLFKFKVPEGFELNLPWVLAIATDDNMSSLFVNNGNNSVHYSAEAADITTLIKLFKEVSSLSGLVYEYNPMFTKFEFKLNEVQKIMMRMRFCGAMIE